MRFGIEMRSWLVTSRHLSETKGVRAAPRAPSGAPNGHRQAFCGSAPFLYQRGRAAVRLVLSARLPRFARRGAARLTLQQEKCRRERPQTVQNDSRSAFRLVRRSNIHNIHTVITHKIRSTAAPRFVKCVMLLGFARHAYARNCKKFTEK